jgi:hypothetical protein
VSADGNDTAITKSLKPIEAAEILFGKTYRAHTKNVSGVFDTEISKAQFKGI